MKKKISKNTINLISNNIKFRWKNINFKMIIIIILDKLYYTIIYI